MRDRQYLDWVRSLGCYVAVWVGNKFLTLMEIQDQQERADLEMDFMVSLAEYGYCQGRVDPDHVGLDRGAGIRASDDTCIPLCRFHHHQRQTHTGLWDGYSRDEMRRFCAEALGWVKTKGREQENQRGNEP